MARNNSKRYFSSSATNYRRHFQSYRNPCGPPASLPKSPTGNYDRGPLKASQDTIVDMLEPRQITKTASSPPGAASATPMADCETSPTLVFYQLASPFGAAAATTTAAAAAAAAASGRGISSFQGRNTAQSFLVGESPKPTQLPEVPAAETAIAELLQAALAERAAKRLKVEEKEE
ncbi:hypothetical protein FPANT_3276 [Fusarium pseudoanthophilum]|uniref:Uncharacterized protein n=1 Tax=Fusarium pseudoanthophilum TaxID=48495 RepID=A0A8H5UW79_9HYPO|nr:hypothetical protein FPANT_3276 [Fusarium pseudoanthophilum]